MYQIKVLQGDIRNLNVDAIVDSAGDSESGRKSIATLGCDYGEVRVISDEKRNKGVLLRVIEPVWRGGDYQEEEHLAICYRNAMQFAKDKGYRSIAFSAISCGALGFPARKAVKIAVSEVDAALRANPLMESVVFCCKDPVTTALYRSQIGK